MLKSPRLALATVFAVVGLSAAPAQAVLTTFANFTGIGSVSGVRFHRCQHLGADQCLGRGLQRFDRRWFDHPVHVGFRELRVGQRL